MAVLPAGFSERVFEFGFNAEYAAKNHALLAAAPFIPTQNAEGALGFDVEFTLKSLGGAVRYLALQHKVARHVTGHSPSNAHFYKAAAGPYFAFTLDPVQFNLIEEVASAAPPYVDFYYCAPLFHGVAAMNTHYMATSVETNSVWIDVAGVGRISTNERHTMIYGAGPDAFVFSEDGLKAKAVRPAGRPLDARADLECPDPEVVYEWLHNAITQHYRQRGSLSGRVASEISSMPQQMPIHRSIGTPARALAAIGELVSRYLDSTLLIEVRK